MLMSMVLVIVLILTNLLALNSNASTLKIRMKNSKGEVFTVTTLHKYGVQRVTVNNLNVRTGPGTKYSVKFKLDKNDMVKVISYKNGWYKIRAYYYHTGTTHYIEFIEGYVSAKYISKTKKTIHYIPYSWVDTNGYRCVGHGM